MEYTYTVHGKKYLSIKGTYEVLELVNTKIQIKDNIVRITYKEHEYIHEISIDSYKYNDIRKNIINSESIKRQFIINRIIRTQFNEFRAWLKDQGINDLEDILKQLLK